MLVNVINGVKYSIFCRTSLNSFIEKHRYQNIKKIVYEVSEEAALEDFEKRINQIRSFRKFEIIYQSSTYCDE